MEKISLEEILQSGDGFPYTALRRMLEDCQCFLRFRNPKYLWTGNPEKQIDYMIAIYNSFPEPLKPKWLTGADILRLKRAMEAVV